MNDDNTIIRASFVPQSYTATDALLILREQISRQQLVSHELLVKHDAQVRRYKQRLAGRYQSLLKRRCLEAVALYQENLAQLEERARESILLIIQETLRGVFLGQSEPLFDALSEQLSEQIDLLSYGRSLEVVVAADWLQELRTRLPGIKIKGSATLTSGVVRIQSERGSCELDLRSNLDQVLDHLRGLLLQPVAEFPHGE